MLKFYGERFSLSFFFLLFFFNLLFSDPPDPITDLEVIQSGFKHVKLQWTVPNSTEPVKYYEIKFATFQVTELNWNEINNRIEILIESSPPLKGQTISYTISNLENSRLYYFAIKSSTSTDKYPLSEISNVVFGFPYNTAPFQFSLSKPVGGVVVSLPIVELDWSDAVDSDIEYGDFLRYEIGLSTFATNLFSSTPSFTGAIVIDNITTSYYLLNAKEKLIDNTTYYWRVKVIDSEGKINWSLGNSEVSRFIINHTPQAPVSFSLQLPIDKSTVTTTLGVFFDWQDSLDPDPQDLVKYYLYISSQSSNYGFTLQSPSEGISWSSYTLYSIFDGWEENTTYWWYVVAKDIFNLETFSATWYFIVNNTNEPPISNFLISPGTTIYQTIHLIFTLNPTFYWTQTYDPDPYSKVYYQLFISSYSENPNASNSLDVYTQKIYTTYYFLSSINLLDDTTYFWRIQIWDEVYGDNVWSSTVAWFYTCIYLNSANLLSPPNNSTTSYFFPKFEWEVKTSGYKINFTSQTLIYWTDNDTTTIFGLSAGTTFYIPTKRLKNNTTYYWQIITHSKSLDIPLPSTASAIFNFYVRNSSPSIFDLSSPSSTIITSNSTTFYWQTSSDEDEISYTIFYSTNNFLNYFSSSGIKTTSFFLENLQDNTTYSWYVKAIDIWGQSTLSNSTFYFVVNYIPQNPTNFALLRPNNNSLLINTYTTFYWETSYDPDPFESIIYELKISTDINFSYISFSTKTNQNNFFLPKGYLEVNTTYYWIVVASSTGSGFTFCSSTFSFKIINTPPIGLSLISPQNYTILKSSPIKLKWNPAYDPQEDDFWYELYYTTDVWISTIAVSIPYTQNLYEIVDPVDDTTYYWYIVAIDTYNNRSSTGPFIFYTSFSNQPPTQPKILSPNENEVIFLPYTIEWSTSIDSDLFDEVKYSIYISTDEKFNTFLVVASSISYTKYILSNFELSPATYYLNILAFDRQNAINFSTVCFYIDRYYISISSPQNGNLVSNLPIQFYFSKVVPKNFLDKINYKIIISSFPDFSFKFQEILSDNFYKIASAPIYPATYYWYIEVYYNSFYAGGSSTFSFVVPYIVPQAPQNVKLSTQNFGVLISWDEVKTENIWGYRVYRGFDINSLSQIYFTTMTYYIDFEGIDKDFFYKISCINNFGQESSDNTIVRFYLGEQANFYISEDKSLILTVSAKENLKDVKISKTSENLYEISANKKKTDSFVEIIFYKPKKDNRYILEYFDGYNWRNLYTIDLGNRFSIKTQYLGKYRLLEKDIVIDELVIFGCSPKKHIITPNNDGINDYIEFQYKVDSYIDGEIYNINLGYVCKLKRKANNILYFDGKDEKGKYLPSGVYIYYIKSDKKNFSGTIVIKY